MGLSVAIRHAVPGFALDITFDAPVPGVTALFGASGAGKSMTLAAIAGLIRPEQCRVSVDGERLDTLPTERRRVGFVFQDSRLFPHLSVAANLRYGLRRASQGGALAFDSVISLLDLRALLARKPRSLSGGEKQRVAIGRALLSQPRLLLMDEPLSALDAARRSEILPFLARLRGLGIPIIYVSHALDEVLRLADTLVLIEQGRVLATGPVGDIAARLDLPLAARDDAASVLEGVVRSENPETGLAEIICGTETLRVPALGAAPGTAVRIRVPAREIVLALDKPGRVSVQNVLPARVHALAERSGRGVAMVALECAGGQIVARVTADSVARLGLREGTELFALIKSVSVQV